MSVQANGWFLLNVILSAYRSLGRSTSRRLIAFLSLLWFLFAGAPIAAVAQATGAISGNVTDESSAPLSGIHVDARIWNATYNYWQDVGGASTGSDGTYDLGGLSTGTYRVCFSDWTTGDYARECHDDAPASSRAPTCP